MADDAPLVQVRLPRHLTAGWSSVPSRIEVQARSFPALLERLEQRVPGLSRRLVDDQGALRRHLLVFVNESNVPLDDARSLALRPGDRVLFIASVSGG